MSWSKVSKQVSLFQVFHFDALNVAVLCKKKDLCVFHKDQSCYSQKTRSEHFPFGMDYGMLVFCHSKYLSAGNGPNQLLLTTHWTVKIYQGKKRTEFLSKYKKYKPTERLLQYQLLIALILIKEVRYPNMPQILVCRDGYMLATQSTIFTSPKASSMNNDGTMKTSQ